MAKKNTLTFLRKNDDYKLIISKSGEQLILIFNDDTAVTLSLIELANMTKFALIKQSKIKKAA